MVHILWAAPRHPSSSYTTLHVNFHRHVARSHIGIQPKSSRSVSNVEKKTILQMKVRFLAWFIGLPRIYCPVRFQHNT